MAPQNVTYVVSYSSEGLLASISEPKSDFESKKNRLKNEKKQVKEDNKSDKNTSFPSNKERKHEFKMKCLAVVCRLMYTSPRFKSPRGKMRIDYDGKGHITRLQFPSGMIGWEIVARPEEDLFMMTSLTQSTLVTQSTKRYHVNRQTLRLKEVTVVVENNNKQWSSADDDRVSGGGLVHFYSSSLKFHSRSFLAKWHISQISLHLSANNHKNNKNNHQIKNKNSDNGHVGIVARYNYSYNNNLRVTSIQSHIDTTPHYVSTQKFDYDVSTGLLTRSGDFYFRWSNQFKRRIISRQNFKLITEWEQFGKLCTHRIVVKDINSKSKNKASNQLSDDEYSHNNSNNYDNANSTNNYKLVYKSMIISNHDNKPQQWSSYVVKGKLTRSYNYRYDHSGSRLLSVESIGGEKLWRYEFDEQFVSKEIEEDNKVRIMETGNLNEDGLLEKFEKEGHSYKLKYDSCGMLESVEMDGNKKDREFVVKFLYDAFKRLISVLYHGDDRQSPDYRIHFFYNHPTNIFTLTHSFSSKNNQHTSYHYDNDNFLIGLSVTSKMYYVATDYFGSPVLLVDEDDYNNVLIFNYSPTGRLLGLFALQTSNINLFDKICCAVIEK